MTVSLAIATAQVTGGFGTDTILQFENLIGSGFNDILTGDTGINVISAGNGNDTLTGATGNDTLTGGAGNDTFTFATGSGADIVTDFTAGTGVADVLRLSFGSAFDTYAEVFAAAAQVNANTVITMGTNTITLNNVTKTALVADDMAFF